MQKLTSTIKAEITDLDLAIRLARLGGNNDKARAAKWEKLPLVSELDRRARVNAEQNRLYRVGRPFPRVAIKSE